MFNKWEKLVAFWVALPIFWRLLLVVIFFLLLLRWLIKVVKRAVVFIILLAVAFFLLRGHFFPEAAQFLKNLWAGFF